MRVHRTQVAALLAGMEQAFDTLGLERLLIERCNLKLSNLAGFGLPFSSQAQQVHLYFDQRNMSEQLVVAMRDARPLEAAFVRLADTMGFTNVPETSALEVLVRSQETPYQDVVEFRSALAKAEAAVCRVETTDGFGTGVLVSKNLVLTNHHVVASVLDASGKLNAALTCLFDYKKSSEGYTTPARRVKVSAVVAFSPPASEDYKPHEIATNPDQLDYALVSLSEDIGDQPIVPGGEVRGYIKVDLALAPPSVSDGLILLQHPLSQPMKIDIGTVTAIAGTRLKHSVNTEKGSSGAPILDVGLRLVALHHAGFEWPTVDYPYNQAIPLALICEHAKRKGVAF